MKPGRWEKHSFADGQIQFGRDDEGDYFVQINTEGVELNDPSGDWPQVSVYLNDATLYDPKKPVVLESVANQIKKEIATIHHEMLAGYCQYLPEFQEKETSGYWCTAWGQRFWVSGVSAHDLALASSTEELERLHEEDDWGDAWEMMDGESREYWENDTGKIDGLTRALEMLWQN